MHVSGDDRGAARSPLDRPQTGHLHGAVRDIVLEFVSATDQCTVEALCKHLGVDRPDGVFRPSPGDQASASSAALEALLVTRELDALPDGDPWPALRHRIHALTSAAAALDKHLAEVTQSRHRDLMEACVRATQAEAMRNICESYVPRLRESFDAYSRSSLRNAASLSRTASHLAKVRRCHAMLLQVRGVGLYRDIVSCHGACIRHRILAAAVAVDTIDRLRTSNPETARLVLLRSSTDYFTSRLQSLVRNCAWKVESGLDFHSSLRLFHLLGLDTETAAARVLAGHRRQIFGIALITMQRYLNSDAASPEPWAGRGAEAGFTSPGGATAPSCSVSHLAHCARKLGPNMILLMVCKVLGEFTTFFESAAASLDHQSAQDGAIPKPFSAMLEPIYGYISELDENGVASYRERVLAHIRRDFASLPAYACSLLVAIINEFNIAAARDRSDYLKVALLLRFFVTAHTECIAPAGGSLGAAEESDNSESTCAVEDDVATVAATSPPEMGGVREVLRVHGQSALEAVPKDEFSCSSRDALGYLEALEDAIHDRILTPYVEHFYSATMEKLRMCVSGDSLQRLMSPATDAGERYDVFALHYMLTKRVRQSSRHTAGIRLCPLNPYNGWTPSSAFLGVNITSWQSGTAHPATTGWSHRRGGSESVGGDAESSSTSANTRHNTSERYEDSKGRVSNRHPQPPAGLHGKFDTSNVGGGNFERRNRASAGSVGASDTRTRENIKRLECAYVPTESAAQCPPSTTASHALRHSTQHPDHAHGASSADAKKPLRSPASHESVSSMDNPQSDRDQGHVRSEDELAAVYRDFGCVFTASSFTLWSQLPELHRVLALQPLRAHAHLQRLLSAFDWLLLQSIRSCGVPQDQRSMPKLGAFVLHHQHIETVDGSPSDGASSISILARRVNAVESVATLLELLHRKVDVTLVRCAEVADAHYTSRFGVVAELRAYVYPLCMLSLLNKKIPTEGILQALHSRHVGYTRQSSEISELYAAFVNHIRQIWEFVEAADGGSIPLPVKALLWRYACIVVRGALRPVVEVLKRLQVHYEVATAANGGCKWAQEICNEMYTAYRADALAAAAREQTQVTHLAAYVHLLADMRENWE
ncbi:hypothetical protein, conserved [Babesia bigemina]|uniref:Uncharacterized protein n=1 Tax=Babesia bigemina TaxID=5866 RepID=A0A061DCL6_BABBI|nr:hypothetical protein, conserved [Babesia bigemina]CDR97857.1 hypothetical protein, conserved [Babesia bigemina]|eukprot:XP_012770043.1 hypothetical protein, conserved [Babesia bigemina]